MLALTTAVGVESEEKQQAACCRHRHRHQSPSACRTTRYQCYWPFKQTPSCIDKSCVSAEGDPPNRLAHLFGVFVVLSAAAAWA